MWRSRRSHEEKILRSSRPEAREEFVSSLARRVARENKARHRVAWSRVAFAAAASTMILGVFAAFGGLGYAASGASTTYSVVKSAVADGKLSVDVHKSSAAAQYDANPNTPAENVAGQSNTESGSVAGVASGQLPFTGLSLLVAVVLGLAFLTAGIVLRRRERSES